VPPRSLATRCTDRLAYAAVRLVICVIQALPRRFCERAARRLSRLLAHRLWIRRQVIGDNLRLAFPELTDEAREEIAAALHRSPAAVHDQIIAARLLAGPLRRTRRKARRQEPAHRRHRRQRRHRRRTRHGKHRRHRRHRRLLRERERRDGQHGRQHETTKRLRLLRDDDAHGTSSWV
jgi:lauroyl/myristoyl acyltransferase